MTTSTAYPQRPPYFAHRYVRLLTKTCAAQDIGHVAFVLCVAVVHQEDAKRYKEPVTFFNEQLMPLIGVSKWEALDRARKRAVAAGWLRYDPGNRGQCQPGRYWATIPDSLGDLADVPCDESQYPAKGEWDESQSLNQYPAKGEREGEHSTLYLNPIHNHNTHTKISSIYEQLKPPWNSKECVRVLEEWFAYLSKRGKPPFDRDLAAVSLTQLFETPDDLKAAVLAAMSNGWLGESINGSSRPVRA